MKRFLHFLILLAALLPVRAQVIPDLSSAAGPDDYYWDSRFGEGKGMSTEFYSGVADLARLGNYIYATGQFDSAGGHVVNNIARYDGASWAPLPGSGEVGLNRAGLALASIGNDLFVGGYFDSVGGIATGPVARWDGSAWHSLGQIGGQISDLLVVEQQLYAGGSFYLNGGTVHATFARWTGTEWQVLGTPNLPVLALAVSGNEIHVGGSFDSVDKIRTGPIAKWNITTGEWSTVAEELRDALSNNASVYAIEVIDDEIFAGGRFDRAGDREMSHIARLNGGSWQSPGGGIRGGFYTMVYSIEGSARSIYVGGTFDTAGEGSARNIAQWDRVLNRWDSLGSGVDQCSGFECLPSVTALLKEGPDLYVGGSFTIAGNKPSLLIGRWSEVPLRVEPTEPAVAAGSLSLSPSPANGTVTIGFTLSRASEINLSIVDLQGNRIATLQATTLLAAGSHTVPYDASALPAGSYFCRLATGDVATVVRFVKQ